MQIFNRFLGFVVAVACIFTFIGTAQAASKADEARFVAEVKQAILKKDTAALSKLVYWDQADDKAKSTVKKHLAAVIERAPKEVSLEDWSDFPFKTNIPVTKKLRFAFSKEESGGMPVGEKDGKLMIAAPMEGR